MSLTAQPNAAVPAPHAEKRAAAFSSVLAAFGITLLKLITGLLTGSLGMLSEAAHSGIDLIAAAITLLSVNVSDRPADEDHNYGHGKIESLSAFVETGLMLISSIWIVYESLHRILGRTHLALVMSPWPIVVLLLSIAVDYTRSRNLHRVAVAYASEALEADAVHFGTDIWSSFAVLLGLSAAYAGERFHIPGLELADPIAALVVSLIILKVCYALASKTIDNLLDATPPETRKQIRRQLIHDLLAIPGVISVDRLRTRRSGATYFADLTLGIPRNVTFQRSEQITMAATAAVQLLYPGADVVVHSVPTASLAESVHDRIRAVAARANLSIHDVSVQQYDGHLHVEQHLEVDETLPLRQAHDLVTKLEADMRLEVPAISTILTHIESEPATILHPAVLEHDRQLERRLRTAARAYPKILDIHDVLVTHMPSHGSDRIQVNCHCTLPDDLPMSEVHDIITALEGSFKLENPEVARLLIHPEPATDNRR
ncbi:cation diffusion facilitator family transporter [Granulicella pectinivorans]|jgi:cation diffusion facilitator family transporter|uniref:Cation diffusion facilitator family transporter n=1 Tax=Granulicella pectinivorans TaxID=474950 RepID=A0A1I6MP49_9BACT|nr:cation diffusion facilitator family transporter [Granulicella pectinivorans]SFS17485.1 cation diffusion facilitator family transporter [Granulicella pectinivorans]